MFYEAENGFQYFSILHSRQPNQIMSAEAALTPSVSWAQRPKLVFVTINVSDVVDPDIKVNTDSQQYLPRDHWLHSYQVEKDSLHFKGTASGDKKLYEVVQTQLFISKQSQ